MIAKIIYYAGAFLKYALVALDGKLLHLGATEREVRDYAKNNNIKIQ